MDEVAGAPGDLGGLTDAEALMWRLEEDPWLSSAVGVVAVLDRRPDHGRLRRRLAAGVAAHPLLSARVVPGGRLGGARWAPDPEFDLDHHVRELVLPGPVTDEALAELGCRLVDDPFDRTRPLWRLWTVRGKGARSALVWKLHHALTDGQAALGLAALFVDLERAPATPAPELEPDELRDRVRAAASGTARGGLRAGARASVAAAAERAAAVGGGSLELARRLAGDALLVGADPSRLRDRGAATVADVARLAGQVGGRGRAGSARWAARSRHRRLAVVSLPLPAVRRTARSLGGTINDLFVAMVVEAAVRLHEADGEPLDRLSVSFIVSTRDGAADAGRNRFLPVRMEVPVAGLDALGRYEATRAALAERRTGVRDDGLIGRLTGLAVALPTPVLSRLVRAQAAGLDVATSCLRGPDVPLFVAGARARTVVPIGPLAGTPANLTAVGYDRTFTVGVHADPAAVGRPELLAEALEAAYCELGGRR